MKRVLVFMLILCGFSRAVEIRLEKGAALSEKQLSELGVASEKSWITGATIRTSGGDFDKERHHFRRKGEVLIIETINQKVTRVGRRSLGEVPAEDNFFDEERKISYFDWTDAGVIAVDLKSANWSGLKVIKE